jgi:hypothetical protein
MGNGERGRVLLIAVLGMLVATPAVFRSFASAQEVSPADDAYHLREWADGRHDANYTEWWYFNLVDSRQDLKAVFTYFVTDPTNLTGHGLAQVAVVAYTPPGVVSVVDEYTPELFTASSQAADVSIGSSAVQVIDADTYRIVGATRDGRLSWDLTYARESSAWFAADRMAVGTLPWERMSWLVYMPRAVVSGRLAVDGQVYSVTASGYHDHNWGEWVFTNALWNWAQYSAPGLSFELGDFIGGPTGMAALDVEGQRTLFTKDQYSLVHTRWAHDRENGKLYPVESFFVAANPAARLIIRLRVTVTEPLRGDVPAPLPAPIIYEQTAQYDGWFQRRDPSGSWLPPSSFHGTGFKEYTAKTLRR